MALSLEAAFVGTMNHLAELTVTTLIHFDRRVEKDQKPRAFVDAPRCPDAAERRVRLRQEARGSGAAQVALNRRVYEAYPSGPQTDARAEAMLHQIND